MVVSLPGSWSGPSEHSLAAGWGAAAGGLLGGGGGGGLQMVEEGVDVVRLLAEACDSLAGRARGGAGRLGVQGLGAWALYGRWVSGGLRRVLELGHVYAKTWLRVCVCAAGLLDPLYDRCEAMQAAAPLCHVHATSQ